MSVLAVRSTSMTRRKQVIISTLVGGLGNQMFQYAVGRALALRQGSELQLDLGWLVPASSVTRFQYELGSYPIEAELITAYRHRRRERVREIVGLAPPVRRHTVFPFDPTILDLPGPVRLVGYWQSEKYFKDFEDVIRSDFARHDPLDGPNSATAAEIEASTAVCVSIRRGDYVSNPDIRRYHGVLPLEYYRSAVDLLLRSAPDAHLFVFSDDLDWCRANLRLEAPMTFVDHDQNRPADDLRLMALCRHHIIANSSFSWWGAWLAPENDKIVIAPKRWAAAEDVGPDLIPERWIRL